MPAQSVQQALIAARAQLAHLSSANIDARLLLQHALGLDHAALIAQYTRTLSEQEMQHYEALLKRRAAHEPVSHIIGARDFWKDRFMVSADVLDPRADSEALIEAVLKQKPDQSAPLIMADFGTGSGCLLLSLLREYPHATGIGIDKSAAALAVASRNAQELGLAGRATFLQSDWAKALQSRFDVLISNPPYIGDDEMASLAPDVLLYEPHMALAGGVDGLSAYQELLPQLAALLKPDGVCVIELGAGQYEAVKKLAEDADLCEVEIRCDLAGHKRALTLKKQANR